MALIFKNADKVKNAIMASQKKEIAQLYEKWADEIGEKAKYYSHKSNASSVVSERQMKELQKMLRTTSQEVSNEIYSKIKKNMYTISDAVVADNVKWLESFGFSKDGLNAAFNYVPDEVIRNLVTGQIYDTGWSLSARIWSDNEQTLRDVYQVMAKGLAENKPVYEIAKDLEAYVRPSAKLPWNPVLAMKNTKTGQIEYKRIYKKQVDYNAQRLARTLAQHSYQQSFVATTQKNPFITDYIWHSNGSRPCELCQSRDGQHFKKNELPMDHPNGMCTMEPNVVDNMVDQLADWFNSPDGTYPEIDEFAKDFGYETNKSKTIKPQINYTKYTSNDAKRVNEIYKSQIANFSSDNKLGIKRYTGDTSSTKYEYEKINGYLRKQTSKISAANQKAINAIDDAISKFTVKEPFIAKRGVDLDAFSSLIKNVNSNDIDALNKALTNVEFIDDGYMSTSWNTWNGFYREANMMIKVPEGTGLGVMVGDVTTRNEQEFILKRGTKVKIESVSKDKNGIVEIVCEIIT